MALITVIGASGRQGIAQVSQALQAGYDVRAISRQDDPFAGYDIKGVDKVEVRPMDLYDTETFRPALEGSDYIFYTHPLQARADRAVLVGQVGAVAADLDVKRVVWNTSSWIPDRPGDAFTYAGNTAGINALWRSGAPGTVFGSVLFMDNLLTNWARPFIVNEDRYVYPHNPELHANWISLDDVAKFMLASLERPDMEGAWLNIGGPERLVGKQVAGFLSDKFGKPIKYDPCTPREFGDYLVSAAGDDMPAEAREEFAAGIAAFYEYNNTAPTKPFEVDMDHVYERFPELEGELEVMSDWINRQDWSESNHRPAFG
ncbi:SDR family oxidoreductase [Parerythrobacter jejuensis]|uniref:NAD(P)H-binding protein n=1 Tax=Parerythrobacter jejuensis TaxID=795812 RepID=A0A845AWX3_9SPHN|nr:NmrA family NAD(P)-binding protein [Parerythrobacter jejuensis]MXP30246.1 NAD(P)H-binding protein [Parerythrobacter jejuensis]MXP33006.1 NAD(P)H-binding protein [Parerythrobacter jejuensis]